MSSHWMVLLFVLPGLWITGLQADDVFAQTTFSQYFDQQRNLSQNQHGFWASEVSDFPHGGWQPEFTALDSTTTGMPLRHAILDLSKPARTADSQPEQSEQNFRVASYDWQPSPLTQGQQYGFPTPPWEWIFLPSGTLYHTYWASSSEPRLSTQLFYETTDGIRLDSRIAGRIGFVRYGLRDAEEGFQFDLLAGVNLRQNVEHYMDMEATDYRFDLPLTYKKGAHAWKFGYYHLSSHVGDEYLQSHPTFRRLNYHRDALYLGYSYSPIPILRFYGELDYGMYTDICDPWAFQIGVDFGPNEPTGTAGAPFVALNYHIRQELDYKGNFQAQFGWAWHGESLSSGTLRTGPFLYKGYSPQYSFYQKKEAHIGWGVWYDY